MINLSEEEIQKIQKWAATGWLIGLLFSIVGHLYTIRKFSSIASSSMMTAGGGLKMSPLEMAKLLQGNEAVMKLLRNLLEDSLNLAIPMNMLKISQFNQGTIGLIGTVTSCLGMYSNWPKN